MVAGKGGVGKTTVTAALARMAARLGLSVLVVEVEGKSGLAAALGFDNDALEPEGRERPSRAGGAGPTGFSYEEQVLPSAGDGTGEIRARTLTPDMALLDYLEGRGLKRISRRMAGSGALDVVATGAPGIKDILVLGKVKQLEASGAADLIVLDAPAAGHAVKFLFSPRALLDAVTVGPIRSQAEDVLALLTDPSRCQVMLVTAPEETPVNEAVETAYALEEEVGTDLGPIVVNSLYPALGGLDADPAEAAAALDMTLSAEEAAELGAAAAFRAQRQELQHEQVARLAESLPLPQLHLPLLFDADLGPAQIDRLASALIAGVEAIEPTK
jgi:anion-transporting  ArsA/GET3 family ATPase